MTPSMALGQPKVAYFVVEVKSEKKIKIKINQEYIISVTSFKDIYLF